MYLLPCTAPWLMHSHTWDVGVTEAARDSPLIHLQLQGIDFIYVTRYPAHRHGKGALETSRATCLVWQWDGKQRLQSCFWGPQTSTIVLFLGVIIFHNQASLQHVQSKDKHQLWLNIPSYWKPLQG